MSSRAHALSLLGHERFRRVVPEIVPVMWRLLDDVRQRGLVEEGGTLSPTQLWAVPFFQEWVNGVVERAPLLEAEDEGDRFEASELIAMALPHIELWLNFELARRKVFWVADGLAFLLAHTNLDIEGRALALPFPSFAIAFQDDATVTLARALYDERCGRGGVAADDRDTVEALTVYVVRGQRVGAVVDVAFYVVMDCGAGNLPRVITASVRVEPDATLDEVLASVGREKEIAREVFGLPQKRTERSAELKHILRLAVNAILYANSAVPAEGWPLLVAPAVAATRAARDFGAKRQRRAETRAAALRHTHSNEAVFHLAGKIPIAKLAELRAAERLNKGGKLFSRFMVRGNWRRPPPTWADQRLRWIEPYWKGPEMATIIEREYRMTL